MSRRSMLIAGAALVAVVGWYLFRPERLWIDQTVDEQFPAVAAQSASPSQSAAEPRAVASGSFRGIAHETSGKATIYELEGGERLLRLTEFQTSNGPDVQVYLVAAADAPDNDTVKQAGFVSLGALKGNVGDQNYELPAGVDLAKYRAVTIWCRRFGVNFGTAPLGS